MIAHFFTLLRIFLSFFLFTATLKQKAILIFIAACTDFLDGLFARLFNSVTPLGIIADPIADKIFITCLFLSLAFDQFIPWWILGLFFIKDFFIIGGYIWIKRHKPDFVGHPLFIAKLNVVAQISYAIAAISHVWLDIFMILAVATTVLTLIGYIHRFYILRQEWRGKNG